MSESEAIDDNSEYLEFPFDMVVQMRKISWTANKACCLLWKL